MARLLGSIIRVTPVKTDNLPQFLVKLRTQEGPEDTRIRFSVIESPRRLVWRAFGGVHWNGEVTFRPAGEGTEVRLVVDYRPPGLSAQFIPVWNVGGDLLSFQNFIDS